MKKSLVRILTDCLCLDLSDEDNPKVDLYGSLGTELKYQIYVKYKVGEKTYKVKIDLHNTTCVLGVYGVGNNNSDKVEGKSIAEFFVEKYLLKVVGNIKLETDIIELNKKYRELAKLGLQNLNKKKHICFECEKEVKDGNNFKCAYCKKIVHGSCGFKKQKKESINFKESVLQEFTCNPCLRVGVPPIYAEGEDSPFRDQIKVYELEAALTKSLAIPLIHSSATNNSSIPQAIVVEIDDTVVLGDTVTNQKEKGEEDKKTEGASATDESIVIELTNSRNDLKAERAKVESLKNQLNQKEVSNARIIEENEEEKKKLLKTIEEQNKQLEQMTSKIRELEVSVASKSDNNSREDDIARLRSILEEETKEKNKVTLTLNDEISNLKREIKHCEEEVIISVREKSNLAEDNRILLKTIDALNVLVLTRNDKTTNGSKSDHNSAQKEVVSGSISENNSGAKKKLFQCNECVFTCTERALLQKHTENQHKRIRTEYQCIQCGKGFESSDALK